MTKDIKFIAHRGYHEKYIENTYDAFIEAGKRKSYGIETDIYLTKDDVVICNHNNKIEGMDKNIIDCNYDEIKNVTLQKEKINSKVCLFADYLDICKKYNKTPIIEFKMTPPLDKIHMIFNLINKYYGDINNVEFISFGREICNTLNNIKNIYNYTYKIARLVSEEKYINEVIEDNMDISIYHELLNKELVNKLKNNNIHIKVWTINDKKSLSKIINLDIRTITSDIFDEIN